MTLLLLFSFGLLIIFNYLFGWDWILENRFFHSSIGAFRLIDDYIIIRSFLPRGNETLIILRIGIQSCCCFSLKPCFQTRFQFGFHLFFSIFLPLLHSNPVFRNPDFHYFHHCHPSLSTMLIRVPD